MKEHKFRAISQCRGEKWVYGDLRHYNRNPRMEKWTIHNPETGMETDIDPETVGEFTGLYDKNGREIYEGDILNIWLLPLNPHESASAVVKWNENRTGFVLSINEKDDSYLLFSDTIKYEVIGNIYDNPELMKGDNK